ncbi:hypothetical protein [Bradyrhizobium sp.]|uniref:hypothetical protein n=1 Tax=Bradyrhizobium sp. TaxID=376 RepID=UPI0025BC53C9|nr:hypothetical protein [Bradyrhizobium sp.]
MRGTARQAFDINEVERDVIRQLENDIATLTPATGDDPRTYAPPVNRVMPLPEYVTHRDGVSEIGMLSAEAVVREYENAAKEIEAMGKETAKRCVEITASVVTMLEDVRTTAAHFRKEAQRIFNDIESCSALTEEVRSTCDALKKKIGE